MHSDRSLVPVSAHAAIENHEQRSARTEQQHSPSSLQPPSPISQNEAQGAHPYSSVAHPASPRSTVISSLHRDDEGATRSRKVSSRQESSTAHSEYRHKHRTSTIKEWSRTLPVAARAVNQSWFLETLSCLVALIALAATITILSVYNDRPLPHWPYSITVNSLISLFVTISKAALLLAIAEGILLVAYLLCYLLIDCRYQSTQMAMVLSSTSSQ